MKYKLTLLALNGGPFRWHGRTEAKRIRTAIKRGQMGKGYGRI